MEIKEPCYGVLTFIEPPVQQQNKKTKRERERERRELHLFNRLVQFSSVCFALDYSLAFYKMGLTIHDSPFM